MQNIHRPIRIFLGAAALIAVSSSPSLAGFEWTPPVTQQAAPPMMAVPAEDVSSEILPSMTMPQESPMKAAHMASVPAPAKIYETVEGFGSDIPLVLAMSQVVPAGYSYSFEDGIDQAMRVSWSGGAPWDSVLKDALHPHDIDVTIIDETVWVRKGVIVEDVPAMAEPIMAEINVSEMSMPEPLVMTEPQPLPLAQHSNLDIRGDNYVPTSYPRRSAPVMDRDAYPAAPTNTLTESSAMPVPLMPIKKAEPVDGTEQSMDHMVIAAPPPAIAPMGTRADAVAPKSMSKTLDPFQINFWQAEKGEKLRSVLSRWSDESNVSLIWNAAYDYELPANIRMHGTFPDVITQTLMTFAQSEPRPLGKLHPNLPNGPSVLIIETFTSVTN